MLAGRYSIDELLGQGGMATVYRGTDVKLGRQVAIKVMRANLADDEQFRSRFRQEAQSASRLAHPSVVRVLDAGDDLIQSAGGPQRLPFIVMEYVDGQNLRDIISEEQLTATEACRVMDAVLTALEYSHRAGIVHRDIKPANIMVTRTGQVKVMDFGIARAVSETSSTVQQTTAILGTAAYFSPEQAKGETVDTRTDLYSAGVLLYELLAGGVPFKGDTAVAVAYQHVSERPQPPSLHNPEITPELDRVVLHSLAKDRNRRFQTASEFRDALRQAAAGVMPRLESLDEQSSVLWAGGEEVSESDLALRRLSETGGSTRSQSRPPVMWVWVSILTVTAVIAAVAFWVITMVPGSIEPGHSREIPNLAGADRAAAIQQLEALDLKPVVQEVMDDDIDAGNVVRTDPEPGTRVTVDAEVTVYVSVGSANPKVPPFDSLSLGEYTEALEQIGLTVGSVSNQDDAVQPEGRVLKVTPEPGSRLPRGQGVDVVIASGKVQIPDVTGQSLEVARSMLESLASVTPVPKDNCPLETGYPVIEQSLPPGQGPSHICAGARSGGRLAGLARVHEQNAVGHAPHHRDAIAAVVNARVLPQPHRALRAVGQTHRVAARGSEVGDIGDGHGNRVALCGGRRALGLEAQVLGTNEDRQIRGGMLAVRHDSVPGDLDRRLPLADGYTLAEQHRRLAEKAPHEEGLRCLIEIFSGAHLLDTAVVEDSDAVRHRQRLFLVVRHVDERRPHLAVNALDLRLQPLAQLLVERAERLVHQQHAGLVDERAREGHALLLAAGEFRGVAIPVLAHTHHRQRLSDLPLLLRHSPGSITRSTQSTTVVSP